jgi:hypothetical protein
MKRRGFLKRLLSLPAAVAGVAVAPKVAEAVKALPDMPKPEIQEPGYRRYDDISCTSGDYIPCATVFSGDVSFRDYIAKP